MALTGLMETLAQEVGPYQIRVNQISPGPVKGPRTIWVWNNIAQNTGKTVEEVAQDQVRNISLQRIPEEHEIAAVAVFLACEESSAITGQTIPVSGGLHMGV
jgi:3-oxoacyl-[acyl-carrier protein] reductase